MQQLCTTCMAKSQLNHTCPYISTIYFLAFHYVSQTNIQYNLTTHTSIFILVTQKYLASTIASTSTTPSTT